MDTDALFAGYYVQYRTEAVTPNSKDDEYTIFYGLANEAVNRWASYDNTFWKELYNTLQISGDGDSVIELATTQYTPPDDMRIAGGFLRIFNAQNVTQQRIKIVEPQDAQFRGDNQPYCYFIGDPNNGFTLVINHPNLDSLAGLNMDYVYYKKPDLLANPTDFPNMTQPYFIVHRALANRFRGSRNPYYQSAKNDAEDILKTMQMENNSGNWADPWKLSDNSGSVFGR